MVRDEQIQKWSGEAEAGYDVEELKRRRSDPPSPGRFCCVKVHASALNHGLVSTRGPAYLKPLY